MKLSSKENYQRHKHKRLAESKVYRSDPEKKRIMAAQNARWWAIKRGSPKETAELVFLDEIYVRDKGICYLCTETCSQEDKSMDHIKACRLSGEHTHANVKLAHKLCNFKRYN